MTPASTPPRDIGRTLVHNHHHHHHHHCESPTMDSPSSSLQNVEKGKAATTTPPKTPPMMISQEYEDIASPPSTPSTPPPPSSPNRKQQQEEEEDAVIPPPTPLRRSPRKRKSIHPQLAPSPRPSRPRSTMPSPRKSPRKSVSKASLPDDRNKSTAISTPSKKKRYIPTPARKKAMSRPRLEREDSTDSAADDPINSIISISNLQPKSPSKAPLHRITLQQVEERMSLLFPDYDTAQMPCVASRLFACFTLRNGDTAEQQIVFESVQPILPLLKRLVELEMVLLRDNNGHHHQQQQQRHSKNDDSSSEEGEEDSSPQKGEEEEKLPPRTKKVHFAAFDGSAMKPPSDVMEGSYKAQQDCIDALTKVQEAAKQILLQTKTTESEQEKDNATTTTTTTMDCIIALVNYLRHDFATNAHAIVAAESLTHSNRHVSFPARRVEKAAALYASDLERLANGKSTQWDRRLADAAAQLARYWLRTVLNPVPDRAPSDDSSPQWNSRVCESLVLQSEKDHVAVDDGSLSSLVSDALSNIYHYVGDDTTVWASQMSFPSSFCDSALCKRGIRRTNRDDFTETEWSTLGRHVQVATGFLAAANSAKFLQQLLTVVVSNASHLEAWRTTIHASGRTLLENKRTALQPQDEHLVLLGIPPETLLKCSKYLLIDQTTRRRNCHISLINMARRYALIEPSKVTKKSRFQQLRDLSPALGKLQDHYERSMATVDFPTVNPTEKDEDDEDDE